MFTYTWTSVQDALPEEEIIVVMANRVWSDPVWLGVYSRGGWHTVEGTSLYEDEGCLSEDLIPPTHWMPMLLPPAPEQAPGPGEGSQGMLEKWKANLPERLSAIHFLEWLNERHGEWHICDISADKVLDQYHGIDRRQLERERLALLDRLEEGGAQ